MGIENSEFYAEYKTFEKKHKEQKGFDNFLIQYPPKKRNT